MTASNHALTGALLAVTIKNPALAISLSFTAHFVLDTIPHFGGSWASPLERNADRLFRKVLITDVLIVALLLAIIPNLFNNLVPAWLIAACMIACISPDLVWAVYFYKEIKFKVETKLNYFSRFHKKLQWSESPAGGLVEIVWFVSILATLILKK